jgi:hypothetical protein
MKILFIGGSLNQTSMLHKVSRHLSDHDCCFTPYYADGLINLMAKIGLLNQTILGGRHRSDTMHYLEEHGLPVDLRGDRNDYDLVVTGTDGIIQKNIRHKRLVLVQEGMTTPEGLGFQLVRLFKLPGWVADTSATGLSNAYDVFCVASNGYRDLFIKKGVVAEKIIVTGIPNFDDFASIDTSAFPHKGHVLVATSPQWGWKNRRSRQSFIKRCIGIAGDRELIFKLHPIENARRLIRDINLDAPNALVYWRGNVDEMIAEASTVITHQSSCTFTALALGKEVYSDLDIKQLKKLVPIQNHGTSARKIARVCGQLLNTPMPVILQRRRRHQQGSFWENLKI